MKIGLIIAAVLLLAGCAAPKDFETMSDIYYEHKPDAKQISILVPGEQAVTAMTGAAGDTLYLCDGYSVLVETLAAGDLDRTLKQVSGFGEDQLQLLRRQKDDLKCIEFVWSAAGEGEDQIGRTVILDDGAYHYALTFMADASAAGELTEQWQLIADSFSLDTDQ